MRGEEGTCGVEAAWEELKGGEERRGEEEVRRRSGEED